MYFLPQATGSTTDFLTFHAGFLRHFHQRKYKKRASLVGALEYLDAPYQLSTPHSR